MTQSSSGPRSARRQVLSTHTPRRGAAFLAHSHGSSHLGKVREPLLPTSRLAALFLLTLEPHTHTFHVDRASICSHNCKTMNLRTLWPLTSARPPESASWKLSPLKVDVNPPTVRHVGCPASSTFWKAADFPWG